LFERSLNIYTKSDGLEGINTAAANVTLGIFYHQLAESQQTAETRKEHLYLPQSKYKEAMRIYTKILGPDDPRTIRDSSSLASISRKL
jgi:hypothetical protein